jgi:hypothetical protein
MSLEMAHKVIVPQKKIMSRSFLNSGTLIVKVSLEKKHSDDFSGIACSSAHSPIPKYSNNFYYYL